MREYKVQSSMDDRHEVGYDCEDAKDWITVLTFENAYWVALSAAERLQEWYDNGVLL